MSLLALLKFAYHECVSSPSAKAVSDGSVSFYLDHFVSSRVARVTYGVISSRRYIPGHPEHESRLRNMWTMASGESVIAGGFFPVVLKVCWKSFTIYKHSTHRRVSIP